MSDPKRILQSKFKESHRLRNFGPVITRIFLQGFRCHNSTLLEINSPITALCGLNGVGKSTILQLAAVAYSGRNPQNTYSIKHFIYKQKFDPSPFAEDASVEFLYCQPDTNNRKNIQQLTISRQQGGRWSGYKRRPKKDVLFIGIGSYLPKIEKFDFVYKYPNEVQLLGESSVEGPTKDWICKILSRNYDQITAKEFALRRRKGKINSVKQADVAYSEAQMGFSEARSQYLVRVLEDLPEKSCVLIEEPEISLHPSAQYHFGCYLVDVCIRKGHQIFLATHSEPLLKALPKESRVYLERTHQGINAIGGITAKQAHSLMTDGNDKALRVFVEDEGDKSVAKILLEEIIRRHDVTFLNCIDIQPIGSCDAVKNVVRALKDTDLPIAGVLDADQNPIPRENIFTLPGNNQETTERAPEKEIFACSKVKEYLRDQHRLNLDDFQTSLVGIDHHDWFDKLAHRLSAREIALMTELAKVYVTSLSELDRSSLVDQLKSACR